MAIASTPLHARSTEEGHTLGNSQRTYSTSVFPYSLQSLVGESCLLKQKMNLGKETQTFK